MMKKSKHYIIKKWMNMTKIIKVWEEKVKKI